MSGWLVPAQDRFPTDKRSAGAVPVELVILHISASPHESEARQAARVGRWSLDARKSSTHFCVTRAGRVLQLASIEDRTWHAGESEWDGREGVNGFSVGIDLLNVGKLERPGPFRRGLIDHYGHPHRGHVVASEGVYREPFSVSQMRALARLLLDLRGRIPILGGGRVQGHSDVSGPRKAGCPGPCMPWALLEDVLGGYPVGEGDWLACEGVV